MNSLWNLLTDLEELIDYNLAQADQEAHQRTKGYFEGKADAYIVSRDAIKRILKTTP